MFAPAAETQDGHLVAPVAGGRVWRLLHGYRNRRWCHMLLGLPVAFPSSWLRRSETVGERNFESRLFIWSDSLDPPSILSISILVTSSTADKDRALPALVELVATASTEAGGTGSFPRLTSGRVFLRQISADMVSSKLMVRSASS